MIMRRSTAIVVVALLLLCRAIADDVMNELMLGLDTVARRAGALRCCAAARAWLRAHMAAHCARWA